MTWLAGLDYGYVYWTVPITCQFNCGICLERDKKSTAKEASKSKPVTVALRRKPSDDSGTINIESSYNSVTNVTP